jgi:dihydrofolate reductase
MIEAILATDRKGLIGAAGKLPWRCPVDLRRFRRITMGRTVLMGRQTYESLPAPLAGRRVVVVSRRGFASPPGVLVVPSPAEAIGRVGAAGLIVAGGAEVYAATEPDWNQLYLTIVEGEYEGDRYFRPDLDRWRLDRETCVASGADGSPACRFLEFTRPAGSNQPERSES